MEKLEPGKGLKLNLGTGHGASVLQVIEACREVDRPRNPRRDRPPAARGDPPELVADPSRAREVLGWQARHTDIKEIVASAWSWHENHPNGYDD